MSEEIKIPLSQELMSVAILFQNHASLAPQELHADDMKRVSGLLLRARKEIVRQAVLIEELEGKIDEKK